MALAPCRAPVANHVRLIIGARAVREMRDVATDWIVANHMPHYAGEIVRKALIAAVDYSMRGHAHASEARASIGSRLRPRPGMTRRGSSARVDERADPL